MTGPIPDLVQDFVSAGEATLHFVIACAVLLLPINHLWRSEANLPDEFFGERVTIGATGADR
jgi:hypothetical protein